MARLYDATSGWVYGLALRILADEAAAEEVTLDVYLQVWQRASSYRCERGSPRAWLATIARNRAIDRLRSGGVRRRLERPLDDGTADCGSSRSPEEERSREETRHRVIDGLSSLPPAERRPIELAFFDGLTHAMIAERLDEPLGTVKTRIRRGMMKLRTVLREEGSVL